MRTLINLLETSVHKFGDLDYLMDKKNGAYKGFTYKQVQEKVQHVAAGLISMGLQKGDRVALLSEGRHEWVAGELGVLHAGAVSVPLSVKLSPDEIKYRLKHAGCKMFIISPLQVKKIENITAPSLEKIILLGDNKEKKGNVVSFDEVIEKGKEFLKNRTDEYEKRKNSVVEDDLATICYTSGTTADPKGIMLSHKNYFVNVEQACELFPLPPRYIMLLILPWDHAFAHTAGVFTFMRSGCCIASVDAGNSAMDTLKNIPINIKETKPHVLCSVPALAQNFRKNIENGIRSKGRVAEALFNSGLKIAYLYNKNGNYKGKGIRIFLKPLCMLFDKIIFSKVREAFGGRLLFFVGGGALLDIELQRFFAAIGTPMLQGYGLTEAAPIISANKEKRHKFGSSGVPVINMEIKICGQNGESLTAGNRGEIVVKGDNVMPGYYNNPEATAETIKDGWLYTGDMGSIDRDGFLYVYGRFKSLLIADDGEKYSPEGIEEAMIGNSPYIDQCMLYNNQDPYTVALIVPNKEAIRHYIKSHHVDPVSDVAIKTGLNLIEEQLKEFRTGGKHADVFPQRWLPSAIAILDEAFTEENQTMNSTLKMVRGKIVDRYKSRLKYLYTSEAKKICNVENIKAMQKLMS